MVFSALETVSVRRSVTAKQASPNPGTPHCSNGLKEQLCQSRNRPRLIACVAPLVIAIGGAQPGHAQNGPIQLAPPAPTQGSVTNAGPQVMPPTSPAAAPAPPTSSAGVAIPSPNSTPVPWVSRQAADDGSPACLIQKNNGGYSFEVVASPKTPGIVTFSVERADWSLNGPGPFKSTLQFDDDISFDDTDVQRPNGIEVPFDATTLKPWLHEFTKAKKMLVSPDNNAFQPVLISLSGTTAAIDQMGDCIRSQGIPDTPPPFVAMAASSISVPDKASDPDTGSALIEQIHTCSETQNDLQRLACYDSAAHSITTAQAGVPAAPTNPGGSSVAADVDASRTGLTEARFLNILADASSSYDQGENDMAKGAARPARARALCSTATSTEVESWSGTVDTLSSNSSGKGVLIVRLSPHVTVGTTNNEMSDNLSDLHTLIEPGTELFRDASALTVGKHVVFSGHFAHSDDDCLQEESLTQEGSMHDPEFLFAFSSISAAQ